MRWLLLPCNEAILARGVGSLDTQIAMTNSKDNIKETSFHMNGKPTDNINIPLQNLETHVRTK